MKPIYAESDNIDDLLVGVYKEVFKSGIYVSGSSRGNSKELVATTLKLTNPRSRVSSSDNRGKFISSLGELCWYLNGNNSLDFIQYYIPAYGKETDNHEIYGAYGRRLIREDGRNQIDNIVDLLSRKPSTRRAVIPIIEVEDIFDQHIGIPCTCYLQFILRQKRLALIVNMRSNDILKGLPHDIFCFTMIQEIVANRLNCELGDYIHFVGSLHMYISDEEKIKQYIDEGYQKRMSMSTMPHSSISEDIKLFLDMEQKIRTTTAEIEDITTKVDYWKDLCLSLLFYSFKKRGNIEGARQCVNLIKEPLFKSLLTQKILDFNWLKPSKLT